MCSSDLSSLEGDIRKAYYLSYNDQATQYVKLDKTLIQMVKNHSDVVSADFITPYPPGFPILIPGQVITEDILQYLLHLDVKEIHGYDNEIGFRIFDPAYLAKMEQPKLVSFKVHHNEEREPQKCGEM